MTRRVLTLLLPLLMIAACDLSRDSDTFDLDLFDTSGDQVARLTFERPLGDVCDAIGCGSGPADWRATEVAGGFDLGGRQSGTLYAQETNFGTYRLVLTPEVADSGITIEITESESGEVTGRWYTITFAGEIEGGRVEGRVE